MSIIDDDLNAIFELDGVEAVFTRTGGGTIKLKGFFTDASEGVPIFGEEVQANKPSFKTRTSQVGDIVQDMAVTIDGGDYKVARIRKVGNGISEIDLKVKKAS